MARQTGPEYIAYCRSLKFSDQEIREAMLKAGWQEDDLKSAFMQAPFHSPKRSRLGAKVLWIILGVIIVLLLGVIGVIAYLILQA